MLESSIQIHYRRDSNILQDSIATLYVYCFKGINDGLVKSHIPYVVHASTSSARTEYQ